MAIKSIKDKITNMASGEILGEANSNKENPLKEDKRNVQPERKEKRERPESTSKPKLKGSRKAKESKVEKTPKAPKPPKEKKDPKSLFRRKAKDEPEVIEEKKIPEVVDKVTKPLDGEIEGYEDVLSMLGIKKTVNPEVDFKSDDLDYIEFSQTTPLGFDFDEVTDFISRTKYTLDKLESALKQRNTDLILVASEVKKVEQKMVEQNQAKELEKMIGGMSEEERLIEENMNLRIEVNELKGRLIDGGGNKDSDKQNREIEALKAEIEMLRMNTFGMHPKGTKNEDAVSLPNSGGLPLGLGDLPQDDEFLPLPDEQIFAEKSSDPSKKLPEIPKFNNDSNSIDSMIQDIGGMYDDE